MFSGELHNIDINYYESYFMNSDLSKRSGGIISDDKLSSDSISSLGPIKASRYNQPVNYHYRKIFIKNETDFNLSGVKAYIDSDSISFLSIARELNNKDFSTSATGLPNGYGIANFSSPTSYEEGITIGNIGSGNYTGLWLKIGSTDDSLIEESDLIKRYKSKIYFEGFIE